MSKYDSDLDYYGWLNGEHLRGPMRECADCGREFTVIDLRDRYCEPCLRKHQQPVSTPTARKDVA